MKIIEQDMLKIRYGILCHQCNCKGVMGAGIAKSIARKWPIVYTSYQGMLAAGKIGLGDIQLVVVGERLNYDSIGTHEPLLMVANMLCQDRYGRETRHTDYTAVAKAFKELHTVWEKSYSHMQIYIPYMMGCINAGGDWEVYSKIVEETCPGVIVCRI